MVAGSPGRIHDFCKCRALLNLAAWGGGSLNDTTKPLDKMKILKSSVGLSANMPESVSVSAQFCSDVVDHVAREWERNAGRVTTLTTNRLTDC